MTSLTVPARKTEILAKWCRTCVASINSGGPTSTELILTTTVATGGRYLVRKTDLYYVEEADASLFAAILPPQARTVMKVVGQ